MFPHETLRSLLPWDIPWWLPDHAVFFGVLYAVLATLGLGLGLVVLRSLAQTLQEDDKQSG
ncbi:MAG: hypothetical protein ACOC43_01535 [Desulfohalobiaceae bacterium]